MNMNSSATYVLYSPKVTVTSLSIPIIIIQVQIFFCYIAEMYGHTNTFSNIIFMYIFKLFFMYITHRPILDPEFRDQYGLKQNHEVVVSHKIRFLPQNVLNQCSICLKHFVLYSYSLILFSFDPFLSHLKMISV